MSDEKLVANPSAKKKISFFSAILIVLGGSIGAGIFLRSKAVLNSSGGNLIWAIIVWLIAGFAVVTMALGLVEVASGRNDNLGMIGWAKAFNTLKIYKAVKFFMTYLYLPFTYFFMPYYVIVQFQDGFGAFGVNIAFGATWDSVANAWVHGAVSKAAPWLYFLIGLGLTVWMIFSAGISSRAGNIQNWIVTAVKFIPLVVVTVIGFVYFGKQIGNGIVNPEKPSAEQIKYLDLVTKLNLFDKTSNSFLGLSPFLGVFSALGAIFFAFDGFYVTAGVQSEMKHPEKTPAALTIGLFSMTFIYIIIAVAMTLGAGNGGFYAFGDKLANDKVGWVFGIVNICIAIGIIGILNGFTMWASRWIEELIKEGEIWVPTRVYKYMKNSKMPIVGSLYVLFLSLPFMIIFTAIGAYAYIPIWDEGVYGYQIAQLLSFSDLMANWMAIFAFAFISLSIVGALQNRKKHFIAVTENKHTKWAGLTAVVIILTVMGFYVLDPFVSLGLSIAHKSQSDIISYSCTSALFIIFCLISFLGGTFEKMVADKRQAKYAKLLASSTLSAKEREEIMIGKELNDLILKTYAEARK